MREIERKWIITEEKSEPTTILNNKDFWKGTVWEHAKRCDLSIEQKYVRFGCPEIRVRKVFNNDTCESTYYMFIKTDTDAMIERDEQIICIDEDDFDRIIEDYVIRKDRVEMISADENIPNLMIDNFSVDLSELAMIEIEFSSREQAEEFVLPHQVTDLFEVREVTDDPRYRNSYLAQHAEREVID